MSAAAVGLLIIVVMPCVTIACVVGMDIWIIATGRQSISRFTLNLCKAYPIVAAAMGYVYGGVNGFLMAHLLFTQYIVSGPVMATRHAAARSIPFLMSTVSRGVAIDAALGASMAGLFGFVLLAGAHLRSSASRR